jgi:hypothetical protein
MLDRPVRRTLEVEVLEIHRRVPSELAVRLIEEDSAEKGR